MTRNVKIPRVARRMIASGQTLCAGFTTQGNRVFWLEPSQKRVKETAAWRAINSPFLRPLDGGLFGNEPQSYRADAPVDAPQLQAAE